MSAGALEIVVRADASSSIGTGHVMRCLTLAKTLARSGHRVRFVCREHKGNLNDLLESAGFAVARLPGDTDGDPAEPGAGWERDAAQTLDAFSDGKVDWLIVDHYRLDRRWQRRLRANVGKILVIDDLADRPHDCDVLLDQNFAVDATERYATRIDRKTTLLLGPSYALLGPDYAALRPRTKARCGAPRRVLVSFGGVDPLGMTMRTVEALLSLQDVDLEADIVLTSTSDDYRRIAAMITGRSNIRLHDRVASLAPFMLEADVAIGAGGSTHWERMCFGLPTLVVTVADNQRAIAQALAGEGLIRWLGDAEDVGVEEIRAAIETLVQDGLDPEWSIRCMALVDGRGADRVSAVLEAGPESVLVARHADLGDEDLLLEWANDPVTRANGYNPNPIARDDHVRWYRSRLGNKAGCRFHVVETASGVPIGTVRFDDRGGEWEISYAVAPAFRARGLGRPMLRAALRTFDGGTAAIIGQVKPDNAASRRIFESLGFALRAGDADRLVFERQPRN